MTRFVEQLQIKECDSFSLETSVTRPFGVRVRVKLDCYYVTVDKKFQLSNKK